MFDTYTVEMVTSLDRKQIVDIMKNYASYKKEFILTEADETVIDNEAEYIRQNFEKQAGK